MRKHNQAIEKYRFHGGPMGSNKSDGNNGVFEITGPLGLRLICLVSDGDGWDHVSVEVEWLGPHVKRRLPRWEEMCFIKDLFFEEDEVAIQIHPAKKNYINVHPWVLHLWRPQWTSVPLPPLKMV